MVIDFQFLRFSGSGGLLAGSSGAPPPPPPPPSRLPEPVDAPPLFPECDITLEEVEEILNSFDTREVPLIDPELDGALWFGVNDKDLRKKFTAIITSNFPQLYYCWTVVPDNIKRSWWHSFIHTDKVYKEFNQLGMQRLKQMMNNAKRRHQLHGLPPEWATDDLYQQLLSHWNSDHFKNKSSKAKQSRLSQKFEGDGPHRHTSGAKSFKKRQKEMEKEMGRTPSIVELVARTHKKSDGTYVDPRAERVVSTVTQRLTQLSQNVGDSAGSSSGLSASDQDRCYVESVSPNKGRIYGLGGLQRDLFDDFGAAIPPGMQSDLEQQRRIETLEQQLAATRQQVTNLEQIVELMRGDRPLHNTPPSSGAETTARNLGTSEDEETRSAN
uniref:SerKin11 n=1 Tax=Tarenaya spinosa TaxID=228870 RepID=B2BXP2_9ROSI|nr:SerKin11 [Tarenaya spinosa]